MVKAAERKAAEREADEADAEEAAFEAEQRTLTWEDVEENPRLLERGPASKKGADLSWPVPHLRVVVEGETFIALLDPSLEGVKVAHDGDEEYVAFYATDAYDAVNKALETAKPKASRPKRTRKR